MPEITERGTQPPGPTDTMADGTGLQLADGAALDTTARDEPEPYVAEADEARVAREQSERGRLSYEAGQYAAAQELFGRALQIRERLWGDDHPGLVPSLKELARACVARGLLSRAEELYLRALALTEKQLGAEHPALASSLNSLARVHFKSDRLLEAQAVLLRLLALKRHNGASPLELATVLESLSTVHQRLGELTVAGSLEQEVLEARERSLGPSDPAVATSLEQLAAVRLAEERTEDARALLERALGIRSEALGAEHPALAPLRAKLAQLKGPVEEAAQLPTSSEEPGGSELRQQRHAASERTMPWRPWRGMDGISATRESWQVAGVAATLVALFLIAILWSRSASRPAASPRTTAASSAAGRSAIDSAAGEVAAGAAPSVRSPVHAIDTGPPAPGVGAAGAPAIRGIEFVSGAAVLAEDSPRPEYPSRLRDRNVEGDVLLEFVIKPNGRADTRTLKVVRSDHEQFTAAVRDALPRMRFVPTKKGAATPVQLLLRFSL